MRTNKLLLLILTLVLLAAVVAAALIIDAQKERKMQEQMATADLYIPTPTTTQKKNETEKKHTDAPDLTVTNKQGQQFDLKSFAGKPLVICFWTSWSSDSASMLPIFEKNYKKHGDDIHFAMVNCTDGTKETQQTAETFIQNKGYTFPVYYDTTSVSAANYSVEAYPTAFFIDTEGHAIAFAQGIITEEAMEKGLSLITED